MKRKRTLRGGDSRWTYHRKIEKQVLRSAALMTKALRAFGVNYTEDGEFVGHNRMLWQYLMQYGEGFLENQPTAAQEVWRGLPELGDAMLLRHEGRAQWAYSGYTIIRLSVADVLHINEISKKLKDQKVDVVLSTRNPFPAALIEFEEATEITRIDDDLPLQTMFWFYQTHRDSSDGRSASGWGYLPGGGEWLYRIMPDDAVWQALNFFLNEFPRTRYPGIRTRCKGFEKPEYVQPTIWLPHIPVSLQMDQKGQPSPESPQEKSEGPKRKRPVQHYRRGYWGLKPYGPGRQMRKLTWHCGTVVNPSAETMATHRYERLDK